MSIDIDKTWRVNLNSFVLPPLFYREVINAMVLVPGSLTVFYLII